VEGGVRWIEIVNWKRFQHYKKRSPPWVKLYRSVLDDLAYRTLSDSAQALLVDLWLLASENGGRVAYDVRDMEFRLRRARDVIARDAEKLVSAGFIVISGENPQSTLFVASNPLDQRRGEAEESRAEENGVPTPQLQTMQAEVAEQLAGRKAVGSRLQRP
jgi:hypothetical protein